MLHRRGITTPVSVEGEFGCWWMENGGGVEGEWVWGGIFGGWGGEMKGFARGSFHNVLLAFSQSYVEHDLRKNKIVVPFFCLQINFYELIVKF
jgi:hypothetical protein